MNIQELITKIHENISKDQLIEAINLLEKNVEDKEIINEIILLKSRLYQLEKEYRLDIEDTKVLDRKKNKIRLAILDLCNFLDRRSDNQDDLDGLFEDLLEILEMAYNTFKAQCKIRNKLVKLLEKRIPDLTFENYYDLFSNYYNQMNDEELRSHKIIRGYTGNVIKKYNYKALEILNRNPKMKEKLERLKDLEMHLTIWKSKFESTFTQDESVSLIYVGVEEEMRFPIGIENQIKEYLSHPSNG